MVDKFNGDRRKSLSNILAGSTLAGTGIILPEKWVMPVIHSVILPAHAQTSTCEFVLTSGFVYSTPGVYNFEVPECASLLSVQLRGGGGGAGSLFTDTGVGNTPGGNGGLVIVDNIAAVPGEIWTITVAAGGGTVAQEEFELGVGGAGGFGDAAGGDGEFQNFDMGGFTAAGGGGGGATSISAPSFSDTLRAPGGGGGGVADDSSLIGGAGAGILGSPGADGNAGGTGQNEGGDGGILGIPGQSGGNGFGGQGGAAIELEGDPGSDGSVIINYS